MLKSLVVIFPKEHCTILCSLVLSQVLKRLANFFLLWSLLLCSPNRLVPQSCGIVLVFFNINFFCTKKTTHSISVLILFETPALPRQYPMKAEAFADWAPFGSALLPLSSLLVVW